MSTSKKFKKLVVLGTVGTLVGTGIYAFANYELQNNFTEKLNNVYDMVYEYVNDTTIEIEGLENSLSDKTFELEVMTQNRDTLKTQLDETTEMLENALAQNGSDTELIASLRQEVASLTEQLTNANNTITTLESEVATLEEELANARLKSEEDSQYIAYLEDIVNSANSESAELEEKISILVSDIVEELEGMVNQTVTYEMANTSAIWVTPQQTSNEVTTTVTKYIDNNNNVFYIKTTVQAGNYDSVATIYNSDGVEITTVQGQQPLKIVVSKGVCKIVDNLSTTLYTFE